MYHLLNYHIAHAHTTQVDRSLARPSKVIEQFESILGHLRPRIPHDRLITLTHPTVGKNKTGVLGNLFVADFNGLSLPVPFEGAKTHNHLSAFGTSAPAAQHVLQDFDSDSPPDVWAQCHGFHMRYQMGLLSGLQQHIFLSLLA